jgi:DHA3 family macrolide efflux protein-like MFS transporter
MINESSEKWKKIFFPVWIGQALSLFGSELVQFALIWYLTEETGSASVLAAASFVALLPRVILSPITGVLIDRWDRQRIMILADADIALSAAFLVGIAWLDLVEIWHIFLFLFISAVGSGFHWPAMQASTSLLVPKEKLAGIAGMNQALRGALGITTPLLAALLIGFLPMHGILVIDIITVLIAIVPLFLVSIPQVIRKSEKKIDIFRVWDDIKDGMKFILAWKGLFYLSIASALLNFLLLPGFTFLPLLITEHFRKGVLELSMLESAFSAGMIIGGLVLSAWGGFKRNIYTILFGIIGLAVGIGLVAFAPEDQFILAVAGISLAGLLNPVANGPIFAIMQQHVQPEMQSRVFSLLEGMVSAMMPISMLVAAPLAEWIGIRGWLCFGAIGCLLIGIWGFFTPSLMHIEDGRDSFLGD